ncbi:ATP-dependent acyl-CoA ligase [Bradyrhizobium diazoefficiens]|uniref:Putative crotonobetaine/carnitine-CoA ligase n=1 Tax=Bradyrhizobium diazoefficiens SEMIA 5080 TaxID=754504 RepID=A0A837CI31_9BRAD|nr:MULTISPECIES: ATP-dependent acyl-CoA ligase [Bradyrhizobium]APO54518.1 ATP-dependent acyl-CoA ligase [Bradyrhizobium diazoefficiens]KGJ68974.1 putative crotonobetaine/carnitine-CoA ligase [Bradyrhizobium diazoefficiens SEMIA 5080]KOY10353.1 crotonobetainyl-CoA:carnitine CoA-transferase [Bradyrhizobium diazoefficiens]MCD9291206.1 ATP-dependent acyl-CoA ligase [Bradyrhizobium diazoefficiens]MCD9809212.1 ATP-dependent acyl-CoA ligase [Bradyrhizobium diazoefficiens]
MIVAENEGPANAGAAAGRENATPAWARAVTSFPPSERILSTILTRQAERYGDRVLLVAGETRWTFAQTAAIAAAAAQALVDAGIKPGDRVALMCSNRPEFLQVYLGCAWLGAIAVPINTALRGFQLSHIFRNSRPALLVVEAQFVAAIESVEAGVELPPRTWIVGAPGGAVDAGLSALPLPALGAAAPAGAVRPGDTVAILYTSGTTGPAKGVCCPQAQLFWWGIYSARALGIREGDVLFTTLPLFHTNALNAFYQALLNGCTYVLEPKFSASGFWAAAQRHNATVGYLLGAMASMLLAQPKNPNDSAHRLRVALGGGVPPQIHGPFLDRFGVPLVDGYGSTETNFVFAGTIPSDRPGTMGYLADGIEARIVDENDSALPDGQAGELVLRASEPFAFATGYFGMPEKTIEAWRNLWFHSGDRVVRDADGHYRFIDRMKDSIRRRGENVSSWEVEQTIQSHPAVAACAIYPLPSELGEDEVAAAILLEPGQSLEPVDIVGHCEGQIAYFAIPRYVRILSQMPLTENGKIKKGVLRDAGVTADTWDREAAGVRLRR